MNTVPDANNDSRAERSSRVTNILFVCSQNRLRSPTAERVFYGLSGIEVRSAGTERDAENVISRDDVEWADMIFVMEVRHKKRLQTMFRGILGNKRIINLNIPDEYEFMEPDLIAVLEQRVGPYLEGIVNTQLGLEGTPSGT
jgi:predicted protein tyrosine phosphatase